MGRKKKDPGEGPLKRGGGDTIRELGLKGVLVPVSEDEHKLIRTAASIQGIPMNQFIREAGADRAKAVVDKFREVPAAAAEPVKPTKKDRPRTGHAGE